MPSTSPRSFALAAAAGSGLLLIGALGFQAAGYAPCDLCLKQRWPHYAAVALGAVILLTGFRKVWALVGVALAAIAVALALYHTGVEYQWWAGPAACSGGVGDLAAMSPAELMERINTAPVVRCDQVAWSFLGLSMAAWNGIFSTILAAMWMTAASKSDR